jgi:alpha-glucosidase
MALAGALPGTLCLYQGDELGLPEAELAVEALRDPFGIAYWPMFPGRDGGRTPMPWQSGAPHAGFTAAPQPWLPVPAAHIEHAVDRQHDDPKSPLAEWRAFLAWRKRCAPLLHGSIANIRQQDGVLAFERVLGDERVLCIFNMSGRAARYELPEDVAAAALPVPGAHGVLCETDIALGAWGYLVVELSCGAMSVAPEDAAGEREAAPPFHRGLAAG